MMTPPSNASDASTSATSPIGKIKDVVVYNDPSFHCAFPSVIAQPDGTLLCAFRRAPDRRALYGGPILHTDANSYLVTVESADGGNTWTPEPRLLFAHPLGGSQDPCMVQLSDKSVICTSYGWAVLPKERLDKLTRTIQHPPYAFMGGYAMRSEDGGRTWGQPIIPPVLPGDNTLDMLGRPCPTFNRGSMWECRDGRLVWAVVRIDRTNPRLSSVHLIESRDKGKTWSYTCPIAQDDKVTFNETSLIETAGGQIVAFMRTDNFDGKGAVARSRDGGKTFEPWTDMGFVGHPFHATRLPDNRILLVYGYRAQPFGIRARVLDAEATDIATAPEAILRDDGGGFDIGYPWSAPLPDGKAIVVYYFNRQDGTRHIAGTLVEIK